LIKCCLKEYKEKAFVTSCFGHGFDFYAHMHTHIYMHLHAHIYEFINKIFIYSLSSILDKGKTCGLNHNEQLPCTLLGGCETSSQGWSGLSLPSSRRLSSTGACTSLQSRCGEPSAQRCCRLRLQPVPFWEWDLFEDQTNWAGQFRPPDLPGTELVSCLSTCSLPGAGTDAGWPHAVPLPQTPAAKPPCCYGLNSDKFWIWWWRCRCCFTVDVAEGVAIHSPPVLLSLLVRFSFGVRLQHERPLAGWVPRCDAQGGRAVGTRRPSRRGDPLVPRWCAGADCWRSVAESHS